MYVVKTPLRTAFLLGLLLVSGLCAQAQLSPQYLLNQEAVNLKSGVSLAQLRQQKEVTLSLENADAFAAYDRLVVYLARGNRPLMKQETTLSKHQQMDIGRIVETATAGDRLVIELLKEKDEAKEQVLSVFLY